MPRPRRCRRIQFEPNVTHFRPVGVDLRNLDEWILTRDELESMRLVDHEGIEQNEAGKKMKISQPTFSRLLKSARKKVVEALVHGNSIKIQGGNFKMVQPRREIQNGRGRMSGSAAGGLGGICKCPKCGHEEAHERAVPCNKKNCSKCGASMVRG